MSKRETENFWNSEERVSEFANEEPSQYLVDFFSNLDSSGGRKVLDIGCGGGRNAEMILRLGFEISACDLHESMVDSTRKRIANLDEEAAKRIILARMDSLPYPEESFDYIVSNGVFHNVDSIDEFKRAVEEASRVLKDNGKIVLNIFFSKFIDPNLRPLNKKKHMYITPQNLPLLLLPEDEIIKFMEAEKLYPITPIIENKKNVGTGERFILRGVFQKKI